MSHTLIFNIAYPPNDTNTAIIYKIDFMVYSVKALKVIAENIN